MTQALPDDGSAVVDRLGEPKLVCRTSRKTLFWGFLVASVLGGLGITLCVIVLRRVVSDWSRDVFGSVLFVAVGVFLLWGARAMGRSTNRLRYTRAVVHAGGLSYHRDGACLSCRWEEIQEIRCRVTDHYERTAAVGLIPIPRGATTPKFVHRSFRLTVRRRDGRELVFTDELEHVTTLIRAIEQSAAPWNPRWIDEQSASEAAVQKRG